jgi:hypothetical protein
MSSRDLAIAGIQSALPTNQGNFPQGMMLIHISCYYFPWQIVLSKLLPFLSSGTDRPISSNFGLKYKVIRIVFLALKSQRSIRMQERIPSDPQNWERMHTSERI